MKHKLDLDTTSSEHRGIKGLFERLLRKFKTAMYIFTMLPIYLFACFVLGASLTPSVVFFRFMQDLNLHSPNWVQNFSFAFSLAAGYFLYGTTLVIIAPVLNKLLVGNLSAWRGNYYSAESLKWFLHNGFTYLARFTFLEFVTPSPLSLFFYRAMGMKIGAKCTIGLKATIMGGCEIGEGAKLLPHSVLLPKTKVPAGETWGGVPAQKIDVRKIYADNSEKEAA